MPDHIKILSVNTGKPERIGGPGTAKYHPATTGIRKVPVFSPVNVGPLGLESDFIGNKKHHGGADQAVYLYSREDYAFWEEQLGNACPPGLFGENLTVSGVLSGFVCVGDRYRFGDVLLEVTSPRIPCTVFAAHMGDAKFPKRFLAAGRPGIYCRVLASGTIESGMIGTLEPYEGERVTLAELFATYPYKKINEQTRQRYLRVPGHMKLTAFLKGESESV